MSTTYETKQGDTTSTIARRFYGAAQFGNLIFEANPTILEPYVGGEVLTIPTLPSFPRNKAPQRRSNNPNEVSILINNKRFRFWEVISITRSIDSVDTMSMGSVFQVDEQVFKNAFRPFGFNDIDIFVGDNVLFTGSMVRVTPNLDPTSNTVSVSGYSTPGALNDCGVSSASFPVEFNGQGLQEIATKLLNPFGIKAIFLDDQGDVFDQVQMLATDRIFRFLIKLANQRGLVINNNENGDLVFQKTQSSRKIVASLNDQSQVVESVKPRFVEQEYYSEITGLAPDSIFDDGAKFTLKNPLLNGVYRPFTFVARDTTNGNLKAAVEAKMGRMFASAIGYRVSLTNWRNESNNLWKPGELIELQSPRAMIYDKYKFLIKSVTLTKTNNSEKVVLDLVIPEAYENKIPKVLPWGG